MSGNGFCESSQKLPPSARITAPLIEPGVPGAQGELNAAAVKRRRVGSGRQVGAAPDLGGGPRLA